jgi:hypothetical protein
MSRDHFLQIFWMMHVANDTTEESSGAIKRTKNVHGVTEHIEKYFMLGKNIAIDESTLGFKSKIIF